MKGKKNKANKMCQDDSLRISRVFVWRLVDSWYHSSKHLNIKRWKKDNIRASRITIRAVKFTLNCASATFPKRV